MIIEIERHTPINKTFQLDLRLNNLSPNQLEEVKKLVYALEDHGVEINNIDIEND